MTVRSAEEGEGLIHVSAGFTVGGTDPVLLSLPAWTPGDYVIRNFARNIFGFSVTTADQELRWEKVDFDTWRIFPRSAGEVSVEFDYLADELVCSTSWVTSDLAFFNGTNLFLFPEGAPLDTPATVSIVTEPDWKVVSGMSPGSSPGEFHAGSYHELVDHPFFMGLMDLDSLRVEDRTFRLATYPVGSLTGSLREEWWRTVSRSLAGEEALFGEIPFDGYTTMIVFHDPVPDGSALEHENSFLGVFSPELLGDPLLYQITIHEVLHAWNVKRLRPAEMMPYDYRGPQPSSLLWFSEGLTDYYADLLLVRSGLQPPEAFYSATRAKIETVREAPPVSARDASLSAWIQPRDGTADIYYQEGSLAAFALDVLIRDHSGNQASLDDVVRDLYRMSFKEGRSFTPELLGEAVNRAAGANIFEEFNRSFLESRGDYPWEDILSRCGLRPAPDTVGVPSFSPSSLGWNTGTGEIFVQAVGDTGPLRDAGVQDGDVLLSLGDVQVVGVGSLEAFRSRYANGPEGTTVGLRVRRGEEVLDLELGLVLRDRVRPTIKEALQPDPRVVRVREGLLGGHTGEDS